MARPARGGGYLAALIGFGLALHQVHDAVNGFAWLADACWCRFRGESAG
ncbi:MAG: hypothetical protein QOE45_1693 [Frankiaceae bacterium]|jgi:hypothetical protein|nr:hypothetical protein [Frankiaceae bacterium]